MRQHSCYIITFSNGKVYVGITSGTIESRVGQHIKDSRRRNFPVCGALRKYEFTVEALDVGTKEYVEMLEISAIAALESQDRRFGYNVADGGNSPTKTKEIREKISRTIRAQDTMTRLNTPQARANHLAACRSPRMRTIRAENARGRRKSPDERAAISAAAMGNKRCLGRKNGPETIERMRQSALLREGRKRIALPVIH
jgi:hypothetical protein